jgi:glycerol-3-phosphate dehydrogenase
VTIIMMHPMFSFRTRQENLKRLGSETFDYLIIGGGITGAGIGRDAAMRGRAVALVEKEDFAAGTSSRSSKLVHGGIRYLELYEFGLVFEASRERRILYDLAPYMVRPLPFLYPIYKDADWKHSFLAVAAGMWLYDALALFRNINHHTMLGRGGVEKIMPAMASGNLVGAARYYDCGVDDARLTLLNIVSAHRSGAVVANRARVVELMKAKGQVCGAVVQDVLTGETYDVHARVVINATGPWTDAILRLDGPQSRRMLRPTKGIHILVPRERLGGDHAVAFQAVQDKRLMFIIPWGARHTIIGTTDTDAPEPGDGVYATAEDVEYVLTAANAAFPRVRLTEDDIISTYAGLRPLISQEGVKESQVSREHRIWDTPSGLVCIAGGKLTTYRSMAAQLLAHAERRLAQVAGVRPSPPAPTHRTPFGDEQIRDLDAYIAQAQRRAEAAGGLPKDVVEHLVSAYGTDYADILDLVQQDATLGQRLEEDLPYIRAEVIHAIRQEMALGLRDIMERRLHLLMEDRHQGLDVLPLVAEIAAREMGWSPSQVQEEMEAYRREVEATRAYRGERIPTRV